MFFIIINFYETLFTAGPGKARFCISSVLFMRCFSGSPIWDCTTLSRQETETSVLLTLMRVGEENPFKWSDLNEIDVLWAPKGGRKIQLIPAQTFIKRTLCKKG